MKLNTKYFTIIILMLVLILLFYSCNSLIQKELFTNNITNDIKLTMQFNGDWKLYHNNKLIDEGDENKVIINKVITVRFYDKIRIMITNNGTKGGFIGSIERDDMIFYTNTKDFKLVGELIVPGKSGFMKYSGGRLMGCYKDNTLDRSLELYTGSNKSISECHQDAIINAKPYYGLQNGGNCYVGYNYNKYGIDEADKCLVKCKSNEAQYCGGVLYNQVYSTISPPDILEYNDVDIKLRNDAISEKSKWLVPKVQVMANTWASGSWEYSWINTPPEKIQFCNYPGYEESLPSGCENPFTAESCKETTRINYQSNPKKCKQLFNPNDINFDSMEFAELINRAYENALTYKTAMNADNLDKFLDEMNFTYKSACKLIKSDNKHSDYMGLCKNTKIIFRKYQEEVCKNIPIKDRLYPNDIDNSLQGCSPSSLECEQLYSVCKDKSYCFQDSVRGPKCFLPNAKANELTIEQSSFFSVVSEAVNISKDYNSDKNNSYVNFVIHLNNLIKLARIIEFIPDKQNQCDCRGKYVSDEGLKCYPCQ